MGTSAVWIVVECACRILGISTAAVMCAVGVETLRQGEFHSLAVYLIASSVGMMVFELSFFTDALLMWCLPCPPKWKVFILWKKMAMLGAFQKFLYYTLMSVVCFLHPVLLWHAVIPGTMLLVTGFTYFILSKKPKTPEPAQYEDASTVTAVATETGEAEQTYSFFGIIAGNRTSALPYFPGDKWGSKNHARAKPEERWSPEPSGKRDGRRTHFKDEAPYAVEAETEMNSCQDAEQEETTSDKAPMIRT